MFSVEDGSDRRIRTEKYLSDAIQYAVTDDNAKVIFEYNETDTELLGCVWTKENGIRCISCGSIMSFTGNNEIDSYIESDYICTKCNTSASFRTLYGVDSEV